jgi:head-tail adaptor
MSSPRITHLLVHDLTWQRKVRTRNAKGGYHESYEDIADIKGRVNPASEEDIRAAARKEAVVTHAIYIEPETAMKPNDRLHFGTRIFRVMIPNADTPSIAIYQKVLAEEVQRG